MRISVAMATWNGERFLGEQLASIAAQTRPPDELVISEDASSDGTTEIARRFAESAPFPVRVHESSERVGYSENFARAIALCVGDVVALCDQDDVWRPEKLAVCERLLEADPAASLLVHSARAVDESLQPIWSDRRNQIRRRITLPAGALGPAARPRSGFTMAIRAWCLRTAAFADRPHNSVHDEVRMTHDEWIYLVCGALGRVHLIPEELVLYRRHDRTATDSWSQHLTLARPGTGRVAHQLARIRLWLDQSLGQGEEPRLYAARARLITERAEYLETLTQAASAAGEVATRGLERSIASHRAHAGALRRRVDLYATPEPAGRARRILCHARAGDYRPRSSGGIGSASLVRDLLLGLPRGGHR